MSFLLIAGVSAAVVVLVLFFSVLSRYRKCPSDKIMVIYGRVGKGKSAQCIHGGAAFVWPVIQDYSYLSLSPMKIQIDLADALSKQNIRVAVPSNFTVGISTDAAIMNAAAERLLGLRMEQIVNLAEDIIIGQLRQVIATMNIEEINSNRDIFLKSVYDNVEREIEKIGLRLINANIKDINDASGYLNALGKNAAAKAINDAKVQVAEKDRDGAMGQQAAVTTQQVEVANKQAEAESGKAVAAQSQRVNVAKANATAVEGENLSLIKIAQSSSDMRQKKAEAERVAIAAEKVASANALKEAYVAEQAAEVARATRDKATQTANDIVKAEIEQQKIVIAATASAEKTRVEAKGEADGIFFKMEAQARGIMEILTKQAEGLKQIVAAAGGDANKAATLLIIDKLPELVKTQVEAIKGIKIDKLTVWDSGNGKDGKSSTANFASGLFQAIPPLQNLLQSAGMNLPEWMGTTSSENVPVKETVIPEAKPDTKKQ